MEKYADIDFWNKILEKNLENIRVERKNLEIKCGPHVSSTTLEVFPLYHLKMVWKFEDPNAQFATGQFRGPAMYLTLLSLSQTSLTFTTFIRIYIYIYINIYNTKWVHYKKYFMLALVN